MGFLGRGSTRRLCVWCVMHWGSAQCIPSEPACTTAADETHPTESGVGLGASDAHGLGPVCRRRGAGTFRQSLSRPYTGASAHASQLPVAASIT